MNSNELLTRIECDKNQIFWMYLGYYLWF